MFRSKTKNGIATGVASRTNRLFDLMLFNENQLKQICDITENIILATNDYSELDTAKKVFDIPSFLVHDASNKENNFDGLIKVNGTFFVPFVKPINKD